MALIVLEALAPAFTVAEALVPALADFTVAEALVPEPAAFTVVDAPL